MLIIASITTLIFFGCNSNSIENIKVYKQVKIDKPTWMAENLKKEEFLNGDPILECKTREDWKRAGENKQAAWCYCYYDTINSDYGKLYNFYAVKNPRGLAPKGWQIATLEE